jgi:hypothetical protein
MKVSPETAKRVLSSIKYWGSPGRAAHELAISIEAVRPYTDHKSEAVLQVLRGLEQADDAGKGAQWRADLARIAASAEQD